MCISIIDFFILDWLWNNEKKEGWNRGCSKSWIAGAKMVNGLGGIEVKDRGIKFELGANPMVSV